MEEGPHIIITRCHLLADEKKQYTFGAAPVDVADVDFWESECSRDEGRKERRKEAWAAAAGPRP